MDLQKDWIDYNGHLNMAYYNLLFDRGCDGYFEALGLGPDYIIPQSHNLCRRNSRSICARSSPRRPGTGNHANSGL